MAGLWYLHWLSAAQTRASTTTTTTLPDFPSYQLPLSFEEYCSFCFSLSQFFILFICRNLPVDNVVVVIVSWSLSSSLSKTCTHWDTFRPVFALTLMNRFVFAIRLQSLLLVTTKMMLMVS